MQKQKILDWGFPIRACHVSSEAFFADFAKRAKVVGLGKSNEYKSPFLLLFAKVFPVPCSFILEWEEVNYFFFKKELS